MKRFGIFMFFHPKGIVYEYVTYLLADISKSLDELVIVCNGYLREDGRDKLKTFSSRIYERPNKGFDAAAWQMVMLNEVGMDSIRQ